MDLLRKAMCFRHNHRLLYSLPCAECSAESGFLYYYYLSIEGRLGTDEDIVVSPFPNASASIILLSVSKYTLSSFSPYPIHSGETHLCVLAPVYAFIGSHKRYTIISDSLTAYRICLCFRQNLSALL